MIGDSTPRMKSGCWFRKETPCDGELARYTYFHDLVEMGTVVRYRLPANGQRVRGRPSTYWAARPLRQPDALAEGRYRTREAAARAMLAWLESASQAVSR
jgi:hypothetical protein